ncbi:hypothetical protein [Jannaschia rubra]|nr:hypothetical protein [Jannaschia rubra]
MNKDLFAGLVAAALADAQIAAFGLRETVIPAWPPAKRAFPADLARRLERAEIFDEGFIDEMGALIEVLAARISEGTHVGWEADEGHVRGGYEVIHLEEETPALVRCANDLHAVREAVTEMTRNERLYIRFQPSKRGSSEVQLPLPWDFMLEAANLPADAAAYLLTEKGTPFASSGSLDNAVRKWTIAAGLCEPALDDEGNPILEKNGNPKMRATRSQHGIRKRRAEQIAEASGSVYEVMAYLSHSDPKTAAIYTKRVDRAKLAERAFVRAEAAAEARSVPHPENRGTLGAVEPSKITEK